MSQSRDSLHLGYNQVFSATRPEPSILLFSLEQFRDRAGRKLKSNCWGNALCPWLNKSHWETTWGTLSTTSSTRDLFLGFCSWLEKSWEERSRTVPYSWRNLYHCCCLTSHVASSSEGLQSEMVNMEYEYMKYMKYENGFWFWNTWNMKTI